MFKNMKAKSSSQKGPFFDSMSGSWARVNEPTANIGCSRVWIFFHEFEAILTATEIVGFLKTVKIWVFSKKTRWDFLKKPWIFFKIAKSSKFVLECVSNGII